MKNKLLTIISLTSALVLSLTTSSPAIVEINNNLFLTAGKLHLLSFDEKITSYKSDDTTNFKLEILTDIYNTKQELLIKTIKPVNNKLTVHTASRTYKFDINFDHMEYKDSDTEKFELDLPPILSQKSVGMNNYVIDSPPRIK